MKRRGEEVDEGFDLVSASNHEDAPSFAHFAKGGSRPTPAPGGLPSLPSK
jgi:hypothetical protein